MAMFKRTFARTIQYNCEGTANENVGLETRSTRKSTQTSPRTLPWNFMTVLSAPLIIGYTDTDKFVVDSHFLADSNFAAGLLQPRGQDSR